MSNKGGRMKKAFLLMIFAVLMMPVFAVKATTLDLQIGQVFYTNKSPFVLEGKAQSGSEIEVHGQGINFKVGEDGTFKIELKVVEGVNLFAITAAKNGASSTKGFMVEMDTTPPEVTLLIKDKLTQEKEVEFFSFDASEFTVTGFTEPGCTVLADDVDYSNGKTEFEAKFKTEPAPSKTPHNLIVKDKYGNQSKILVQGINVHIKVVKMQISSTTATIDGKEFTMPVPVTIIKGSTMVPLRFMGESIIGGSVDYNAATKTITISARGHDLVTQVGSQKALFDGVSIKVSGAPPTIVKGSLMTPFRFIGEAFGFTVGFDSTTKMITISENVYP
jgi:hypothetical protein